MTTKHHNRIKKDNELYIVKLSLRTVEERIDDYGNITPANTKFDTVDLVKGAQNIANTINFRVSVDTYIVDFIAIEKVEFTDGVIMGINTLTKPNSI